MLNKFITGNIMASLIEQYVDAINRGAAPNVSSAWDTVLKTEINQSYERAKAYIKKAFRELSLPMDVPELY